MNNLKQIIEIADYIYANPDKKISDDVSVFCSKFQRTERTIWSWVARAQEYNKKRLQIDEKIRNDIKDAETKKAAKAGIKTRNDLLKIYWDIVTDYSDFKNNPNYKVKKVDGEILLPIVNDVVQAGREIAKICGFYEAVKTENNLTISSGDKLEKLLTEYFGLNEETEESDAPSN